MAKRGRPKSVSPQLEAIRRAAELPPDKREGENEVVRFYCRLKDDHPQEFARQWKDLESEHKAEKAKREEAKGTAGSEEVEKVNALIDKLLAKAVADEDVEDDGGD